MGLLGSLFSNSSKSTQTSATSQTDARRVNSVGNGSIASQDGSTVNYQAIDPGAFDLATLSVDKSLGLAGQIATTLGASVGQFSVGAASSVDSLTHLYGQHADNVEALGQREQQMTMVALAVAGLIALVALKGR